MANETVTTDEGTAQMARPLLAYRCPAGFDTTDELCRAFGTLLGATAPRHALRRIRPDQAIPPLRPEDIFVALHAQRRGEHSLSGQLEWRDGTSETTVTGPEVRLDSSDTELSPAMYGGFLRDLWELGAPPALGGRLPEE